MIYTCKVQTMGHLAYDVYKEVIIWICTDAWAESTLFHIQRSSAPAEKTPVY